RERRVAQEHLLPHRRLVTEQQLGELVAQHRHPPPLRDIEIIDETAARLGDLARDDRDVIRPQADRAAVSEARERLGGPYAEQNDDPVAQSVKALPGL